MNSYQYVNNVLHFDGVALPALAQAYGTPLYVYSESALSDAFKAYEQAFATRRDYLLGKTVLELDYLPVADRQTFHAEDMDLIRRSAAVVRELEISFGDGSRHQVMYSVSGFRLADGRPGGLIGVLGAGAGVVLGVGLCLVQHYFGVIEIPADSFLVKTS